jgi:methanethiol S-methyltransferase
MKYLIVILLWIGYCVIHSFLISIKITRFMNRVLKRYYAFYRFFYIIISFVLIIPLINFSTRIEPVVIISYGFPITVLRYVLIFGSLLMFFWSFFFNYDSLSFFGIRQILNFYTSKTEIQSDTIKKSGFLGVIRHPMYFALLIYLWCHTFTLSEIIVNSVLTIYIIIGTKLEEKKLVLEFGDEYIKYKSQVPMLIPFTKPKIK